MNQAHKLRSKAREIVLVRHGRPCLSPRDPHPRMDATEYAEFWRQYDLSDLAPGQKPPRGLHGRIGPRTHVFASPILRSRRSAEATLPGQPIEQDAIFVEAALPPPRLSGLKFRPIVWGVISRVFWRLGHAGGMESFASARQRAIIASDRLEQAAESQEQVILFGHGWFNRMIVGELKRRGWRLTQQSGGHDYWSFRILEREGNEI